MYSVRVPLLIWRWWNLNQSLKCPLKSSLNLLRWNLRGMSMWADLLHYTWFNCKLEKSLSCWVFSAMSFLNSNLHHHHHWDFFEKHKILTLVCLFVLIPLGLVELYIYCLVESAALIESHLLALIYSRIPHCASWSMSNFSELKYLFSGLWILQLMTFWAIES